MPNDNDKQSESYSVNSVDSVRKINIREKII